MPAHVLHTTAGDFPLVECRLELGGRALSVLHAEAILDRATEDRFVSDPDNRLPYGAALWPAALALAHDLAGRAAALRGRAVLELGAGCGLPGIAAAALGARVLQTDRNELALHLCQQNGARNRLAGIGYRRADWVEWPDLGTFDWIIGSDVLYADALHEYLRHIFETNLAPGGRVLLADPYRRTSMALLERMEAEGWTAAHARWSIADGPDARPVGVYELARRPG